MSATSLYVQSKHHFHMFKISSGVELPAVPRIQVRMFPVVKARLGTMHGEMSGKRRLSYRRSLLK